MWSNTGYENKKNVEDFASTILAELYKTCGFFHMQILKFLKSLMRICQSRYDPNVAICQQS